MNVVQTLDEGVWQEFVDNHPQSQIFHTPEMFRVFARAKGHQPTLWATVGDDERVLALLLPVQVALLNGLFRRFTARAVVYGSVLCAPGAVGQEALAVLLRAYGRRVEGSPLFTELRNLSDMTGIQPILQDNNFVYDDHLNFLIDLQLPVEKIWGNMHSNVRTNVRKARRMGVTVEEVASLDKIPVVYTVLAKVYEHIRVPLAHPSLFEAAFEVLYPRRMIKIFVARAEDVYIGAAIRLIYKDVIYAWYAGAIRDYASYKANDLLVWHVLEWGAEDGFSYFDFGGAGKPDEDYGPRKFKAKFHGTLVNYGRNTCVHAPTRLEMSKRAYDVFRRFL